MAPCDLTEHNERDHFMDNLVSCLCFRVGTLLVSRWDIIHSCFLRPTKMIICTEF
jgi:hypothetical protein